MEGASLALIYQKGILNKLNATHVEIPFSWFLVFLEVTSPLPLSWKKAKNKHFWLKKSSVLYSTQVVLDLVTTEAKHFCGKNRWKAALQTVRYMNKTAESDAAFVCRNVPIRRDLGHVH